MKATRKLIPAFAMLLIAAVMMSTATFAWFSTNSQVTADGFHITAKADSAFIVIHTDADQVDNKLTKATVSGATKTLPPAKATVVSNAAPTWQTGTADDPADANSNVVYTDLADASAYTVTGKVYIRSAKGFPAAKNLVLKEVTVDSTVPFADAISVILEVGGKYYHYVDGNCPLESAYVLATDVTDTADIEINITIYINGDNENVKTNNATAANLKDMPITLTFATGETIT